MPTMSIHQDPITRTSTTPAHPGMVDSPNPPTHPHLALWESGAPYNSLTQPKAPLLHRNCSPRSPPRLFTNLAESKFYDL